MATCISKKANIKNWKVFFLDNINLYYVEKIIYVLSMLFSLKSHGPLYKLTEFHKNNCNQLISCEVAKVLNIIADVLQFWTLSFIMYIVLLFISLICVFHWCFIILYWLRINTIIIIKQELLICSNNLITLPVFSRSVSMLLNKNVSL